MHLWEITTTHGDITDSGQDEVATLTSKAKRSTPNRRVGFKIYDDDGIKYYTGAIFLPLGEPDEDLLLAPIRWACANAGAVRIKFNGHPEWEIYL